MPDFPDIRRSSQWGDTAARQWQNLMHEVTAVAGMQVGDGLVYEKVGEVMRLTLASEVRQRQPKTRTVVLVKPVDLASMVLTVREVRYRNTPPTLPVENPEPEQVQYTWHEDVFQAFPEYGYRPADYEPFFWDMVQDGVPDLRSVFFKARFERDVWIVDMSGAIRAEKLVVIRGFGDDNSATSKFLLVQEVRLQYDAAHQWTGEWAVVEGVAPVEVNIWPNMKAGDFAPFVWYPDALNPFVTFLPLRFTLGVWWVVQQFKSPVSARRGALRLVDCQPVEE